MDQFRSDPSSLADLVERIKSRLLEAPGKTFSPDSKEAALPKAAVSLILHHERKENKLLLLLIQRKTRVSDPWSGQMALPGGRYIEKDQNVLTTVIREVLEETGLDLRQLSILGALDEIVSGSFAIRVTPYVALAESAPNVTIDSREVDGFFWIPLSFFEDRNNVKPYSVARLGEHVQVPSYMLEGNQVVWGMTLRIIENLIIRIQK
jgi:8-oxo-dGTP pyrophosphatase MutT (NUDIX family)